jgi:hypothetical protein
VRKGLESESIEKIASSRWQPNNEPEIIS